MASRLELNLQAIKNLIALKKGETTDVSSLQMYTGFGGLAEILFDPDSVSFADNKFGGKNNRAIIKEIYSSCKLLDSLYNLNRGAFLNSVKRSTSTAYYTPDHLIKSLFEPLNTLGIKPANFLDPSAGAGVFSSNALKVWNSKITQIEKELITGEILRYLYPSTKVYVKPFESFYPENSFDLIATNIPFGNIGITDVDFFQGNEVEKLSTQRVHNYFLIKSLKLLEDEGIMVLIMPTGIMDSQSNKPIRQELLKNGHILNLLRLPNNVFKESNTEVVSDIMLFQKDSKKEKLTSEDLLIIDKQAFLVEAGKQVAFNAYFEKYKEKLLGDPFIKGLYGDDFDLRSNLPIASLYEKISSLISSTEIKVTHREKHFVNFVAERKKKTQSVADGLQLNLFDSIALDTKQVQKEAEKVSRNISVEVTLENESILYPGALFEHEGTIGILEKNKNGDFYLRPESLVSAEFQLYRQFIKVKNVYRMLVDAQTKELANVEELRTQLNTLYDDFTSSWGTIYENSKLLGRYETQINTYLGLEKTENDQHIKGDIFFKNTFGVTRQQKEAELTQTGSLYDILLFVLNEYGSPRLEKVANLSGLDEQSCFEGLSEYLFKVPEGGYKMKDEYLSGDILTKIEKIEEIVNQEIKAYGASQFERNLEALKSVKPKPIAFEDISISLGQRWIPLDVYNQFLRNVFGSNIRAIYRPTSDAYLIEKQRDGKKHFGYAVSEIIEASMNSKMLKYYDIIEVEDGKNIRKLNPYYTKELQKIQQKYNEDFQAFLKTDPVLKKELEALYNEKYNRLVKRKYNGQFLRFEELKHYTPFPYQKDSVFMGIQNNGGYFDHCVGAGKTLTMIITSYELKRLKIVNKPAILAIKSTLTDIASEYKRAYPNSKILVADDRNFVKAKREQFFSQIVNEDWDCIIMSHDNFGKIPQDKKLQMEVIQEEIDRLEADLDVYRGEKDISKRMLRGLEQRKESLENDLKELGLKKDETFTFQSMGIDHLFVDEADSFKNLRFTTRLENVKGLGSTEGAEKTKNLLIAIRSLQKKYAADKGVTFLSGTPISNSISEMYSILKYLAPSLLEKTNLISFDAWQKHFAQVTNDYEMTVTGEIKPTQRLSVFVNLPELLMLYSNMADVRVEKDIVSNIKDRPKAHHELVNIPPLETQLRFCAGVQLAVEHLDWSFLGIGIDRPFDEGEEKAKMLLATKFIDEMSLDMKLIAPSLFSDYVSPKLAACAEKVMYHYHKTDEDKGTQLIFCDKGTPKYDGSYSVYDEIKKMLVSRGIPESEIAFIHDAGTDKERKELFTRVNQGEIRVLLGSTGKLGTGTNVQKRIVAMHHLDTLWRPRDMRQRIGRGERQGNAIGLKYGLKNYIYATEKTLDAYKFNMLDGKERFIEQIKKNEIGGRTASQDMMDDESTMSFSQIVAILSGDNRLLRKTKIEREVDMLLYERKEVEKTNDNDRLTLIELKDKLIRQQEDFKKLSADYKLLESIPKDEENKFFIFFHTPDGQVLKKAGEIGEYLKALIAKNRNIVDFENGHLWNTSCTVGDFKIIACKIENLAVDGGLFSGSTEDIRFYLKGNSSKLYSSEGRSYMSCEAPQLGQFIRDSLLKIESGFLKSKKDIDKLQNEKSNLEMKTPLIFNKEESLAATQKELEFLLNDLIENPIKNPLDEYKKEIFKTVTESKSLSRSDRDLSIIDEGQLIKSGKNLTQKHS